MNRLKAKAPRYDFVVYQPYGSNPFHGVMMATWVSREVALKALRKARASVAPDAYEDVTPKQPSAERQCRAQVKDLTPMPSAATMAAG